MTKTEIIKYIPVFNPSGHAGHVQLRSLRNCAARSLCPMGILVMTKIEIAALRSQ